MTMLRCAPRWRLQVPGPFGGSRPLEKRFVVRALIAAVGDAKYSFERIPSEYSHDPSRAETNETQRRNIMRTVVLRGRPRSRYVPLRSG
jgi:hypothetical protein